MVDSGPECAQRRYPDEIVDHVVFLDRDNTLIANDGDLGDPAQVALLDGVPEGLCRLRDAGYRLVVVTNQGGVARGRYEEEDVDRVHREISALLDRTTKRKGLVDRYYYCPYHPDATRPEYRREHPWRKPQPGMLLQAARDLGLDLPGSWLIGDQSRDIEAGRAAGCRTVLIGGLGPEPTATPTAIATDFTDAVDQILTTGEPGRLRRDSNGEAATLRRAIQDLSESIGRRQDGAGRDLGVGLLFLSPLPFVAGLVFIGDDDPTILVTWLLVTVVVLLGSIACLLTGRR